MLSIVLALQCRNIPIFYSVQLIVYTKQIRFHQSLLQDKSTPRHSHELGTEIAFAHVSVVSRVSHLSNLSEKIDKITRGLAENQ